MFLILLLGIIFGEFFFGHHCDTTILYCINKNKTSRKIKPSLSIIIFLTKSGVRGYW